MTISHQDKDLIKDIADELAFRMGGIDSKDVSVHLVIKQERDDFTFGAYPACSTSGSYDGALGVYEYKSITEALKGLKDNIKTTNVFDR